MATLNWTSKDLENLPDTLDDTRYEVIEGELYRAKQPHWNHQEVCFRVGTILDMWSRKTLLGKVSLAPGLIFSEDDDVAPDVVWISKERLATALQGDGKLHSAPELVIEALSPGTTNEKRDQEIKLKLYSRRGVLEYWIIDWRTKSLTLYRREQGDPTLQLKATLYGADNLTSPLLPGFSCKVAEIFEDIVN